MASIATSSITASSSSIMAPAETLALVASYLTSSETQVLCNAATALAAIGTLQSVVHLTDLAILQPDPSVRRRAIAELRGLNDPAKQAAAERARDLLLASLEVGKEAGQEADADTDLEQAGRANEVLVALRKQGVSVALPEPSFVERPEGLPVLLRRLPYLTPAWARWRVVWWHFTLHSKLRRYLVREQHPTLAWWALSRSFLGALVPGSLLTVLLFFLLGPPLSPVAYLGIGLPGAVFAAVMAAIFHDSAVPIDCYCEPCWGALVETLGVAWRPGGAWWRQFLLPLALVGVTTSGLLTLQLGFDGLGANRFHYLAWLLLASGGLLATVMAMRGGAAWLAIRRGRWVSALGGALIGSAISLILLGLSFLAWPHPGIAVLVGEGVILLLPLTTAFFFEHLLAGAPRRLLLPRTVVWPLIAVLIVLTPAVWLQFNPLEPPQAISGKRFSHTWQLAQVPIERSFRVGFKQHVKMNVSPASKAVDLEPRLFLHGKPVESTGKTGAWEWALDPGEYRLVLTVGDANAEEHALGLMVRESYVAAVGLVARALLEGFAKTPPPPRLVGGFELELVLNAEGAAAPQ